jgi:hypothetical protein
MADPGQGAFDNPAFGDDLEAGNIVAFDDLQTLSAGLGNPLGHDRPLIAAIGKDHLDERAAAAGTARHSSAPSRSCTSAVCTVTPTFRPSVSTMIWRLRPVTFLPAS